MLHSLQSVNERITDFARMYAKSQMENRKYFTVLLKKLGDIHELEKVSCSEIGEIKPQLNVFSEGRNDSSDTESKDRSGSSSSNVFVMPSASPSFTFSPVLVEAVPEPNETVTNNADAIINDKSSHGDTN